MNAITIAQKELADYLTSNIAYAMMGIFLLSSGFFFWSGLTDFAEYSAQAAAQGPMQFSINELMQSIFESWVIVLIFVLPIMTMRLIAAERKAHTLEFLLASPSTTFDIVMGKFIAAMSFYGIMMATTIIFPILLHGMIDYDLGPVFTSYLGFAFLGAGFIAFGMFTSSLSQSQMIAALLGFGCLLVLYLFAWLSATTTGGGSSFGLGYFSISERFSAFTKGLLRIQDIVFWVSFSMLFLVWTHQRVESFRYR